MLKRLPRSVAVALLLATPPVFADDSQPGPIAREPHVAGALSADF